MGICGLRREVRPINRWSVAITDCAPSETSQRLCSYVVMQLRSYAVVVRHGRLSASDAGEHSAQLSRRVAPIFCFFIAGFFSSFGATLSSSSSYQAG